LNYAAPARVPLRRLAWRLLLLAWAIFTLYLAYDWWWPWLRLQVPMLLAQRRCMRFTEPGDRVVIDSGTSLVGTGTGVTVSTAADQRFKDIQDRWDELKQLDELRNPQRDSDWSRAANSLFAEPPDSESIIFLHCLRSGNGDRLVVVWANWYGARTNGSKSPLSFATSESLSFWAEAIEPASLSGMSRPFPAVGRHSPCEIHLPDPRWHMRLFAGQPDPCRPLTIYDRLRDA